MKINDLWVRSGEKAKRITLQSVEEIAQIGTELESEIVSAILTVVQEKDITICMVVRHGEKVADIVSGENGEQRSIYTFAKGAEW